MARAAVVHLNFQAGSTQFVLYSPDIGWIKQTHHRTNRCSKVDGVSLNLLLLKGERCVKDRTAMSQVRGTCWAYFCQKLFRKIMFKNVENTIYFSLGVRELPSSISFPLYSIRSISAYLGKQSKLSLYRLLCPHTTFLTFPKPCPPPLAIPP